MAIASDSCSEIDMCLFHDCSNTFTVVIPCLIRLPVTKFDCKIDNVLLETSVVQKDICFVLIIQCLFSIPDHAAHVLKIRIF